ncbi:MAG: hypothetical protein DRO88_13570, partial [Promethearchaeia archaeon]
LFVTMNQIPTHTSMEEIANGIVNFSSPLQISQQLNNNSINITASILPFLVPINHWDNLTEALRQAPNVLEIDRSYSSVGEYIYTIHSAQIIEGYITHFYFFPTWQDNDGVLQAITIVIQQNNHSDRFSFILSSQKTHQYSFLENPWVLLGIITASVLITIPLWKYQRKREKVRLEKLEELKKQELEQGIDSERREILENLIRDFSRIKQTHKIRWIISTITTFAIIGAVFLGIHQVSALNLSGNLVLVIIVGGITIISGLVFWLSWPIWKTAEIVYPHNPRKWNMAVDISPLLLLISAIALFLIFSSLFALKTIQTWYGRLIIGGLAIFLLVVVGFAFYFTNPWKRMEKIENDLRQSLYH